MPAFPLGNVNVPNGSEQVSGQASSAASYSASPPNLTEAQKATLGAVVASASATAAASLYGVAKLTGKG